MPAARRPDPKSAWVIDTRKLGRRPGSMRPVSLSVPAAQRIGNDVIAVPAGDDIQVEARLEAVSEGVLVSGTASAVARGQCSRCLTDLDQPVTVPLRELYAYPGSVTAETTSEDEVGRLVDDLLDLETVIHDELVLALPIIPLCRPDCLGLCSECGGRLDDLEPGHSHEILDPRWAALREKFSTGVPQPSDRPGRAGSGQ